MLLKTEVYNLCKEEVNISGFKFKFRVNRVIGNFKSQWICIMANLGLYNKVMNTYSLNNIKFTEYGFKCDIFVVPALNFDMLDSHRDTIQENLGCLILFNRNKTSSFINAKFIFNSNNDKQFKKIEYKEPYKIYIGNDYSGDPILIDMKSYPHALITGGTRSGKSVMQSVGLANLIANFSPKDVNLYLCQIAKSDLVLFEDAEHTKAFADTLEKNIVILEYLVDRVMLQRDNDIRPYRKKARASNYHDYNKLTYTDKMSTIYVVFDEMASLTQTKGDMAEIKTLKERVVFLTDKIAQYGASLGVFLVCSLQRPTADNISSFVKAQSTAVVSFRQNNQKSSEVATDDGKLALGLEQREFVYLLASKSSYGIVPWTKDIEIYELIKPFLKPNHRTIFDDLEKEGKRQGVQKNKKSIESIGTHFKTEQEILEENIKSIKGYVPYENPNGKRIVKEVKKNKEAVK